MRNVRPTVGGKGGPERMTDEDPGQGRLQEYGVNIAPSPVDDGPPTCERCGDELDGDGDKRWTPTTRPEEIAGVVDLARGRETRGLCEECQDLEGYLARRHYELTSQHHISGAVDVYCECHDAGEIDVQPVRRGESPSHGRSCSRCGSAKVVLEQLPPAGGAPPDPEGVL